MASWLLKTGIQRAFSVLPCSHWWNGLLQRHVTGGLRIQALGEFERKLRACRRHLDYYRACSRQPREDFSVLEVGTGWFPIIPIGLRLCGAREIWTFDIVRLMSAVTLGEVVHDFCVFAETGRLRAVLPAVLPVRVSDLLNLAASVTRMSPVDFLEQLNIHAIVRDIREGSAALPDGSVDMLFSHGVLEHFPPALLADAFVLFRRLCGEQSVMSHYLGIADQFASGDRSITPFNYLRYSARAWRWLNSPIIPQNRLRVSDYLRVYQEAGFEVAAREDINGAAADLDRVRLAPEFAGYSKEDLLVLFCWLVARPSAGHSEPAMRRAAAAN